jgi:hypothetical protein
MSKRDWKSIDSEVLGLLEPAPLSRLGRYFTTRKHIRAGYPLWTLTTKQITEKNFLGPWVFNIYETILASMPVSLLAWVLNLIMPASSSKDEFQRVLEALFEVVSPIIFPLSLLVLAHTAGWAALRKEDYSREKSKISRKAYLYLDGAYGLIPQLTSVFSYAVFTEAAVRGQDSNELLVIPIFLILFCSLWVFHTVWCTVGGKLFAANGYNKQHHGPCLKYVLVMAFWAGILTSMIVLLALVICAGVAAILSA